MSQLLADFIVRLKKSSIDELTCYFTQLNDSQQTEVLTFFYLQGNKSEQNFDYFQTLAERLNGKASIPKPLVKLITNQSRLMFFTPLLKYATNFAVKDEKGRNVLHYLFVARGEKTPPPFNYIKSLLLFESNLFLAKALIQEEKSGLVPIEAYLHLNLQFDEVPKHEFTAVLALIEAERAHRDVNLKNKNAAISRFKKVCNEFTISSEAKEQRATLIASYYAIELSELF